MTAVTLALVLSLAGGVAAAQAGPISLTQYQRSVHTARLALDGASSQDLGAVRRELSGLGRVRLPDGRIVRTDMPEIAAELGSGSLFGIRSVKGQIDALDDALRGSRRAQANAADLRALDNVLRDPRFHLSRSLWQIINDWINSVYQQFVDWLQSAVATNTRVTGAFALVLVVLVGAFGFFMARGALGRMVIEVAPEQEEDTPSTAENANERAAELAAGGSYREALRYLFLATLLALQEQGLVELRAGLTNREYLRLLRSQQQGTDELRAVLHELIEAFDRAWYGHLPLGEQDYDRCRQLAERAVSQGRGRQAA